MHKHIKRNTLLAVNLIYLNIGKDKNTSAVLWNKLAVITIAIYQSKDFLSLLSNNGKEHNKTDIAKHCLNVQV